MPVIGACVLLVLVGAAMVIRWGDLSSRSGGEPDPTLPRAEGVVWFLRSVLTWVAIAGISGLVAGAIAAGAGGRLVMRVLALTSPAARGKLTEADQIVGRISADGTQELIGFCAFIGVVTGVLYVAVRWLLPVGRARGISFGVLLLVLAGTRVEPLRADNFDFAIVGPPWLAVLAFSALVVFHGMLVAALAERMSVALPWVSSRPAAHGRPRQAIHIGRVAMGVAVVVALPGFTAEIGDIM